MRGRSQSYRSIDAQRIHVSWYWRATASITSFMILGGFLILPATYDQDPLLRVSKVALGIFGVALLVVGFLLTILLSFAVRNAVFQVEVIFLPALISCGVGLLTIFYDFLISARYQWNTAALLLTVAAAVTTVIYGVLVFWTQRRIIMAKELNNSRTSVAMQAPMEEEHVMVENITTRGNTWQDPAYYQNYVQNMFPSSSNQPAFVGYDPQSITEEEMQRQQMLMLLLQNHPDSNSESASASNTFRIEWQGKDDDEAPPHGYYAPQSAMSSSTAYNPRPGIVRQFTSGQRPWDGVWRGVQSQRERPERIPSTEETLRPSSKELREKRRREIEAGL